MIWLVFIIWWVFYYMIGGLMILYVFYYMVGVL